jgi:P27 family predicted phage terminase small subunit
MARNATATNSEPEAPEDLTPAARQEWERITALLRSRKSLGALDQTGLHDYLICWQRLQACEADIGNRGVLVKGYRGALIKNPSVALARQYRESLLAWSKEFGFTIGSRSRLAVPEPERPKVNKFAFLNHEPDGESPK